MRYLRLTAIILASITCVTTSAFAVDGVVLIDQNRALAGNVTPGDAPGFPVTITLPGSYRLSGNLTVPALTNGIVIAADHVTLDLNGFQIAGSGDGSGVSESRARRGIVVRNGSVTNFNFGVLFDSSIGVEVAQIRSFGNEAFGITVGLNAILTGNTVSGSLNGIVAGTGAVVSGNYAFGNQEGGLSLSAFSTVIGNTAVQNGTGISIGCPSNLVANAAFNNDFNIFTFNAGCTRANNNPTP